MCVKQRETLEKERVEKNEEEEPEMRDDLPTWSADSLAYSADTLPHPLEQPTSYSPLQLAGRAGTRNSRLEPKQAMQAWAADKVKNRAPEVLQKTLAVILRAEARTALSVRGANAPNH